jgi:hypothetical protein
LLNRLADAKAERQSYIETFPIPACDGDSNLSIEPVQPGVTTTSVSTQG